MQYSKLAGGFGSQSSAIAGCCCGRFCGSPREGKTEQSVYIAGQPLTIAGPIPAKVSTTATNHMSVQNRQGGTGSTHGQPAVPVRTS